MVHKSACSQEEVQGEAVAQAVAPGIGGNGLFETQRLYLETKQLYFAKGILKLNSRILQLVFPNFTVVF